MFINCPAPRPSTERCRTLAFELAVAVLREQESSASAIRVIWMRFIAAEAAVRTLSVSEMKREDEIAVHAEVIISLNITIENATQFAHAGISNPQMTACIITARCMAVPLSRVHLFDRISHTILTMTSYLSYCTSGTALMRCWKQPLSWAHLWGLLMIQGGVKLTRTQYSLIRSLLLAIKHDLNERDIAHEGLDFFLSRAGVQWIISSQKL